MTRTILTLVLLGLCLAALLVPGLSMTSRASETGPDTTSPTSVPASTSASAPTRSPVSLRVYHIGNSVTDTIRYKPIVSLARTRGKQYTLGRHTMPGTPLYGMLDNPDKGFSEPPFGRTFQALTEYQWDVITLQPFNCLLEGKRERDVDTARRYLDLLLQKSPDVQVYVYSRWPGRPPIDDKDKKKGYQPIDYAALWDRPYTENWVGKTYETRDYFQRMVDRLNQTESARLRRPVLLIPVGDVFYELNRRIKAGQIAGMSDINSLYTDGVHLNDTGAYIVALTFYATIFHDDPRGLPTTGYGEIPPDLAAALQEVVWSVVNHHPYSGVKSAE
jgi:hypothetical protein